MDDTSPRYHQGRTANKIGTLEENRLVEYLEAANYHLATPKKAPHHGRVSEWFQKNYQSPTFLRHARVVDNIYQLPWIIDIVLWHPELWPDCLFIEVKSQNVGGSVDEKIPFVILSLKALQKPSALLMAGFGFRPNAVVWAENQQTELLSVWRNPVPLRDFITTRKKFPIHGAHGTVVSPRQGGLF